MKDNLEGRRSRTCNLICMWLLLSTLFATLCPQACLASSPASESGILQGRFVWGDNAPVTGVTVKLVDSVDRQAPGFNCGIYYSAKYSIDVAAHVREAEVGVDGSFRFAGLASGNYYLFFKTASVFASDHLGRYNDMYYPHALHGIIVGDFYISTYGVKDGATTTVPDFEFVHLIDSDSLTVSIKENVEVSWPAQKPNTYARVTILHLNYRGSLKHPAYKDQEVKGNSWTSTTPLHPGDHQVKVKVYSATEHVLAQSEPRQFTVPGDVMFLRVSADPGDTTGRAVTWLGSDAIRSVRISSADGVFDQVSRQSRIVLPAVTESRTLEFRALDNKGNELVPGWIVGFAQSPAHKGE